MATNANLYVDQGVDYETELNVFTTASEDFIIDDSQTITAAAKKMYAASPSFTIDVIVDTGDGDPNNLVLSIPAARTLDIAPGKYRYDVVLNDGITKTKILEGLLILLPSISV